MVLHPGETSETFTYDADAVIVGPGQDIGNVTSGAYKVSAGEVEITDKDGKKLAISGSVLYFAMKHRESEVSQSGYQPADRMPDQWRLKTQAEMDRDRLQAAATRAARERQAWERERKKAWDRIKGIFRK